jgi:hypothetical protein
VVQTTGKKSDLIAALQDDTGLEGMSEEDLRYGLGGREEEEKGGGGGGGGG